MAISEVECFLLAKVGLEQAVVTDWAALLGHYMIYLPATPTYCQKFKLVYDPDPRLFLYAIVFRENNLFLTAALASK